MALAANGALRGHFHPIGPDDVKRKCVSILASIPFGNHPRLMVPPAAVDPALRAALVMAKTSNDWVVVVVRGDPTRNRPERCIEGIPIEIVVGPDGRERVILQIVANATEQIILLERIAHVRPFSST